MLLGGPAHHSSSLSRTASTNLPLPAGEGLWLLAIMIAS